jgi:hypothetical protein
LGIFVRISRSLRSRRRLSFGPSTRIIHRAIGSRAIVHALAARLAKGPSRMAGAVLLGLGGARRLHAIGSACLERMRSIRRLNSLDVWIVSVRGRISLFTWTYSRRVGEMNRIASGLVSDQTQTDSRPHWSPTRTA